jgi:CDP-diacylglycerol---glycerol-3-phosphate 3-phosphatidyltransferase
MTPPNAITLARMLVVPVVVWLILADFANHERWAAVADGIAAATDSLDGYLARRHRGWSSVGGVFLDPLADKLLVSAALICLVQIHELSAWVAMIVIAREFAVQGLRMVAAAGQEVIAASWLGKYKTLSQNVAIIALLVDDSHHLVTDALIGVAVALTLYSFADYAARASRHFMRPAAP